MKGLKNIGLAILAVVIIASGIAIGNVIVQPQVEKVVEPDFGSRIGFTPKALTYDVVATSTISLFNTFEISTSTIATSTEYVFLDKTVDQVDLFIWVQATSTARQILEWRVSFSPDVSATPTANFYFEDSASISAPVVTHTSSPVVHKWDLGDALVHQKKVTICSPNYDGLDDVNLCSAGIYKIEIYKSAGLGGFEIYTEVIGKIR